MLSWLLDNFTLDQIESYARSNDVTLDQLLHDTNIQIDNTIKRLLLVELYNYKLGYKI